MERISKIIIVTRQEAFVYVASPSTKIEEGQYYICGDPYPCYRVVECGKVIAEIRCLQNVVIEFDGKE